MINGIKSKILYDQIIGEEFYVEESVSELSVLMSPPINLSELGAIANSIASAALNMNILINAINTYGRVNIDGIYYFDRVTLPTRAITNPVCELTGSGPDASKILFVGRAGIMFTIPNEMTSFKVDRLTMSNETAGNIILVIKDTATSIENLTFTNSVFNGNLSFRILNPFNLNNITGFDYVDISNNIFDEIGMNFFIFRDTKYRTFFVRNNQLNNMKASFLQIETSNSGSTGLPIILLQQDLVIEYNTVINDDNCVVEVYNDTYYVFVLCQGRTCTYRHNHVEGMKATVAMELYDIYMTTLYGYYENNVNKNNLNFAAVPVIGNKTFFKSKNVGIEKVCQNNTFIIEESFVMDMLDRFPALDIANTWISSVSFTIDGRYTNNRAVIKDNTFDVYFLKHEQINGGGMTFLLSYTEFSGNHWTVNKMEGESFLYFKEDLSLGVDREIVITGNTITKVGDEQFDINNFISGNGNFVPGVSDRQSLIFNDNIIDGWTGTILDLITLYNVEALRDTITGGVDPLILVGNNCVITGTLITDF